MDRLRSLGNNHVSTNQEWQQTNDVKSVGSDWIFLIVCQGERKVLAKIDSPSLVLKIRLILSHYKGGDIAKQ